MAWNALPLPFVGPLSRQSHGSGDSDLGRFPDTAVFQDSYGESPVHCASNFPFSLNGNQESQNGEPVFASRTTLCLDSLIVPSSAQSSFADLTALVESAVRPWPQQVSEMSRQVLELLPELHSSSQLALQLTPDWQGDHVNKVCLYTDGSHFRHESYPDAAAWSVVILYECLDLPSDRLKWHYGGFLTGQVHTALDGMQDAHFVGATTPCSSQAEASAMVWALAFSLQHSCQNIELCFDSTSIGYSAAGSWQGGCDLESRALFRSLFCLRALVRASKRSVSFRHVAAHDGQPWNELADAIAKGTAKRLLFSSILPLVISQLVRHEHSSHAWLALKARPDVPSALALQPLFCLEGPGTNFPVDCTLTVLGHRLLASPRMPKALCVSTWLP